MLRLAIIIVGFCMAVLPACTETKIPEPPLPSTPAPTQEPAVQPPPKAPEIEVPSAPPTPDYVFSNDDTPAFAGFDMLEVPAALTRNDYTEGEVTLALLDAYNLRSLANEEGVQMWAKTRKADNGDILWGYEFWGIPDDSVSAEHYQALVQETQYGLEIKVIGKRWKCWRSANPNEWTTELCP